MLDCDALLCAGFELVELLFVFGFTVVGWIASVAAVLDGSTEVDCSVEATVSTTETESNVASSAVAFDVVVLLLLPQPVIVAAKRVAIIAKITVFFIIKTSKSKWTICPL